MEKDNVIFVYGTLKKGQNLHYYLKKQPWSRIKYLGKAVLDDYALYCNDKIPFPKIAAKTGSKVQGELYRVGPATEERIDRLEFECGYKKTPVIVKKENSNEEFKAFVYIEGKVKNVTSFKDRGYTWTLLENSVWPPTRLTENEPSTASTSRKR